ncbi:uncharacterized protein [Amphiura filiformis]|uniref:uncharacterized protein n=1 Tax=Amphiura filiformis TaxID=82378 RepID=UPI003B225059
MFMYISLINDSTKTGRDHTVYAYIPECIAGSDFMDRGDHHHIHKRIATSTRMGGPEELEMSSLSEVLQDPHSGLTHSALRGDNKQSVPDAESLLSHNVANSLHKLGYQKEAKYIKTLANWHEAHDGRAIKSKHQSQASKQRKRSQYNYEMLNMILDEYMPWHRTCYDFRYIDINRPLKGILGMSMETIIEVITNIECQEFRRRQLHLPPEHPRAGYTNDSELLFSIFREHNDGIAYTLKKFQSTWSPLCSEFLKQLDEDLPFWYETQNQRFSTGSLEAPEGTFDEETEGNPLRLHTLRVRARDCSAIFIAGRASCPVPHAKTVRTQFHKLPSELPDFKSSRATDHDYHSH